MGVGWGCLELGSCPPACPKGSGTILWGGGLGGIVPETPGLSQPAQDAVLRATHAWAAPSHPGTVPPSPPPLAPVPRPLAAGHTSPFPMRQLSFSFGFFFPAKNPSYFGLVEKFLFPAFRVFFFSIFSRRFSRLGGK